ncbi:hypothetical protein LP083-2_043 [Listeria phage LP-083-2]|uniref:Uncharacterized protein n=3 Tax=Pecentumvirus TaxID=1857844 RepID=A0A059T8H3_9CAUD|nr:hypothetical protein LP083-2_043 [Listeria phage LP-083-2]YP_009784664.1 hypothetical protein QLX40_gp152 [Listeria phage LP-124]AHL19250.1 hypothetical protein LP083-2_043 [Listeria phage LP-083-2]AHL19549.1 hypothetical protein LP124_152 [Listeria phage LP-124]QDK04876.2 hypothetical protein FK486_0029 [Listeria phage LP-066]
MNKFKKFERVQHRYNTSRGTIVGVIQGMTGMVAYEVARDNAEEGANMDFKDKTYEELLAKVRNNSAVTRKDLSTALWLYEKVKAENKRLKSTVKEETNIKNE